MATNDPHDALPLLISHINQQAVISAEEIVAGTLTRLDDLILFLNQSSTQSPLTRSWGKVIISSWIQQVEALKQRIETASYAITK